MQRKQIFSRLITILVILAQVLAGVSSALPAQVALAAAPTPPLVQPAKPSAVSAAANPALAAPRNPEDRTARAAGPELIRPAAPEVVAAAPVAKPLAAGGPASISGLVYSDFNANGVKDTSDVGVGGITVTAYDATGAVIASTLASTTTATLGQYTLSGLPASTPVRLEFTALPAGYQPAVHGAVNGTAVQLVTTTSGALSNVNFGISYPSDYCQNNPFLCTAEMIAGDPQNATTATYSVLKKWSYSLANGSVTPTNLANDNLVGTVWGLAYARGTDKLYSAAFLKRHAGLGPNGLGAIYVTSNPRSGTGLATSLFFDVATVSGINVGTVPSNSARGLTTPSGTALDAAVYDQVGKVGLGDIDISDDESTLWTISLNDKKLLGIPVNNPTPGTVQVYTIPDPGCAVGSGDYRPFATKYYHARLYVGVTCDASISRNQNDLKAVVYRFDPANPSAGFTNVLNVPLNYTKGAVNTSCPSNSGARWYPWVNTPYPTGFNPTCGAAGQKLLPQPLLSDLEFDLDDSLILGFIDRFAHQAGSGIALPDGSNTGETNAGGDILRAWNNSGVFVLENNGRAGSVAGGVGNNQGPGGGEFYQGDFIASLPNIVNEDANGGLAFLAGSGEVVSTVWDPLTNDAHHGVTFFSNTDGNVTRRHDIGGSVQFGKGSGLGDLEILCNSAPIEIGNRVWLDSDGDGVQDAGEPSLANVAVSLYDSSNNRLATVDTDAQGAYYFSSAPGTDTFNAKYNLAALQPNTSGYQVRIDTTQFALRGLGLTTADADSSANGDARDSDAQMSGSNAVSTFATGGAGANNHTYDFGFKFTGVGIGNYVWKDNNANGLQESGEPGIPGVTVGLYDNSGNPALCPQPSTTNLALNQTATQVSLYGAGYEASKAVDGNTASGMSITGSSLNSWWQVDLGQSAQVRQVVIYARPDGFHAQTEQIYVLISNQPFASTTLATTLADPNVWSSTLQGAWTGASLTIAVPTYLGRYVRIQHNNTDYLSLGEVQVFGNPNAPLTTITDSSGHYTFTSVSCLQPSTAYQVRLDLAQTPLTGLSLTTPNAGGVTSNDPTGDDSDSDANSVTISGKPTAVISLTSPAAGVNYSYDFGFAPLEIGNYVWKDSNANGQQDGGEPGIPGITVGLYDATGNAALCPQVGRYDTYADGFNSGVANGSTGSLPWGTTWSFAGSAAAYGAQGNAGGSMYIYGATNSTASRTVDLSVFVAPPTLRLDYIQGNGPANFNVQYSTNGGTSFTTLAALSVNNTSYKTITYTLPITAANTQIRLQGATGGGSIYAYFDNVTLQGQLRYPVTTVTNANGLYTFTAAQCMQPNTNYQVRIDTTQTSTNPLYGLFLTTPNAGGVTSNDPTADDNDSDANSVTVSGKPFAVTNATTPAAGVNYSYDFGFVPVAIGNYVWKDSNANGQQDGGEPGIPGVTVGLYDAGGNVVMCPQVGRYDTYADGFNSGVSNGSTGSLPWGTTWSFAGSATASTAQGNPGGSMYIYGATNSTASRTVDLSVFVSPPTLRLDYIQGNGPANFNVQYSTNGGTSFTTLAALSVNNTSYQTITYTLPITAANTQIRIQGVNGGGSIYAYFDNVTIQGQLRYPVTTVTDANGLYTFTAAQCVQPNTTYQARIDTTQVPANPLFGLFLTTPNAGGVTSNDPTADDNDSDANSVTVSGKPFAVVNATAPAAGVNYSYDFGFVPVAIGNYVWKDSNANGQQDGGEPGIPGITVGLYDATGNAALCPQVGRYDTYADGFNSGVSNGSTGSLPWGTTWSFAGSAAAYGAQGNAGGSMYIYGATNSTASRTVDLSVFVAPPTLRLDYIQGNGPANFNVQYSTNGGTSFTTLAALSVNNTSYKTITYTLPITLANTQIRIQGVNGGGSIYAYFDNVTLQGQVRYPVTTVTDANGLYTFTGTNCVQPNTTYQVRLATNQSPLTNLHLTTQDAGGVTSNDPTGDDTDSDAASVTISNTLYARLTALSPAVGTNYSYDFGFAPDIGTIVLRKVTMPAGSSQSFAFTSNVPGYANFSLRAGTSYTLTQVPVGVYAVTETLPTGWTQIASSCTNMNTLGAIQVSKDSLTTCTVTNAPQPTTSNVLTVTKTVNWNSNAPNAGLNFNINITGPSFPGGKADTISAGQTKVYTNVVGGVYTVTETSPGTGWVMTYSVPSGVVNLSAATIAPTTAGPLSGNVFRDFNADGVDAGASEPGVAGVTVTAYDPNGVVRGTATTDASGNYNFTPTGSGPYRLELTNLPAGYYPTTHGTGNGTSTQFVTTNGGASNVNFGVNDPADYSQSNPMMAAPLYINGNPDTTAPTDAIVKFAYNSSGQSPAPATLSTKAQIGSTWGLAYARMRKTLYASAFLKRHVGLGPNGPGAIYAINGNTGSSTLFADLAALGVNVGTVLSNSARGLGTPTTPNNDASTYAQIGKVGLGDIDIADDERMLYAVNLYDQKLYALNVPAGTLFGSYTIPDPGCSGGAWRPFGLKYKQGALYVGGVCDAQTSQSATDLKAYIYRFTPGTGTFTQVFNFALNYTKGNPPSVGCTGNGWFAWRDTFAPACGSVSGVPGVIYPQPILSDIEFDVDGSMILGFIDRLGHQQGAFNYGPTGTTIYFAASGGDILRAYNNNGTYVLENNGKAGALTTAGANNGQGPGYGEFYYGENWQDLHQETSNGGLALKPGSGEVALTAFDPVVAETGGVYWLSNTTGNQTRGYQLYGVNRTVNFNKGNGLGDLELLSDPAPLEIGDRVWKDLNGNGVQDPGEPGLANVTVALQSPTNTVTTNTDANGLYYFRVSPNTAYTLTVNPSQTPLNGLTLTQANMQAISGSPYNSDALLDTRDSDAVTIGGKATIYYTTGSAGQNNHGLDFGWTPAANGKVTINNKAPRVDWGDNPDQYGTTITKTGAAHIIVPGLRLGATEDTEIDGQANNTATGDGTDEDGVQFPPLTVGRTAVLTVTATNTGSTAATIYGWIDFNGDGQFTASERVTTTVPAGTVNGVFYLTYSVPADAVSDTYARFRLSTDPVAAQPTGVASDGEVEDYPVTIQAVPLVQFGDRVWLESDADGLAGTGVITPIVGMVITATAGTNIYTATTDSQGYYSFTVAPGFYSVSYGNVPPQYGTVLPSATPGGGTAYGNEGSYREAGNPDESYTSPTYVSLVDGEANWHVDFAFHAPHADLHLVKQVNKTVAKSGDTAVYTLVLTNNGPDTTTNVTVDDLLPATVLYQSATAQQGAYDANTGVWTVGTLAVNSSVTLTITVKVR